MATTGGTIKQGKTLMDSCDFGGTYVVTTACGGVPYNESQSLPKQLPKQDRSSWPTAEQFLGMSNEELGRVDPVVMNLAVAKGIPSLTDLNIGEYVRLADEWADDLRARMPALEERFYSAPHNWRNRD